MPQILSLQVERFRNLSTLNIHPSEGINLIIGKNGAGKTSLLEAIFYLSTGKSFRTQTLGRLIQEQADHFCVTLSLEQEGLTLPLGVERHRSGNKQLRVNYQPIDRWAPVAKHLPICLLTGFSQRFLTDGPSARRAFLDWLLFHVEPSFMPFWQRFQRALKQRNAALKRQSPYKQIRCWDQELIASATHITDLRENLLREWMPSFKALCQDLLPQYTFLSQYERGWPESYSFSEALDRHFSQDLLFGYTGVGPHRADFTVCSNAVPAQEHLSQGQQKLLCYALYLSQGIFLKTRTRDNPVYLIDDLPATLDELAQNYVLNTLLSLNSQVFISATDFRSFEALGQRTSAMKMFHVEQGRIDVPRFSI